MPQSVLKKEEAPKKRVRRRRPGPRLTAEDWVKGASAILAQHGIDAVRVEPLAKKLKVTKGSFYWHFKDRGTLLSAVLNDWRKRATNAIINRLDSAGMTPQDRLRGLLELNRGSDRTTEGASLEMAIRQWAKSDDLANEALSEIDNHRHRYIASIYRELGFDQDAADTRAFLLYSTMMGVAYMPNMRSDELLAKCEEILLKETPFE